MIKFFSRFALPPIGVYKQRWLRRVMIFVMFPQEATRAVYHVCVVAKAMWNWEPPPTQPHG